MQPTLLPLLPLPKPSVLAEAKLQGTVAGRELFELVKLLHRTCCIGRLHLEGGGHSAVLHFDQGDILSVAYDTITGVQALTRALCMPLAEFHVELGPSTVVRTITKDTAYILTGIERLLSELDAQARVESTSIPDLAHTAHEQIGQIGQIARVPSVQNTSAVQAVVPVVARHDHPTVNDDLMIDDGGGLESGATSTLRIAAFNPPEPGMSIGKCRLIEEIGRGGSALVYRAHHESLDLDVVVKVLMQSSEDSIRHQLLTLNEAHLLARLNHPNILRIFDFTDVGHYPHLVMEYVDGKSLAALIDNRRRLDAEEALPLFLQVVEALAYAKETIDLVHCDIKPTNVLLTSSMQVKLADFGLAKSKVCRPGTDRLMKDGTVVGTPAYLAPELIQGSRACADHRSDIYSLGITLYQALTGRLPFIDDDPLQMIVKRLNESPIPPHLVTPQVDRRLSQLVMSMLARNPANRIQDYEELLDLMTDVLEYQLKAAQHRPVTDMDGKIIRRRTSFWNYVPNRLFRKVSSDQKDVG